MAQQSTNYIPGVCNINTNEIARRRNAGYFGLALTVLFGAILFGLGVNRYFRIALFVPLFIMAIGFLQAKHKFCVGYGAAGLQNAEEGSENAATITDKSAKQKDKQKTQQLYIQALVLSLAVTLLSVLI